jgi:hypothetical protein
MKIVQVFCDGSMDEIDVPTKHLIKELTGKSKSQGDGDIRFLYSWAYESRTIECYGWFDGDAGFENKHELPPSGGSSFLEESSCQLLFGDLFLIMKTGSEFNPLDVGEYSEFYSLVHGGFDDCDSDDSGPDTPEEDDDYIQGGGDDESEEEIHPETSEEEFETETDTGDSELETDETAYEI